MSRGEMNACTVGNALSKSSAAQERNPSRCERPTQVPSAHNACRPWLSSSRSRLSTDGHRTRNSGNVRCRHRTHFEETPQLDICQPHALGGPSSSSSKSIMRDQRPGDCHRCNTRARSWEAMLQTAC